MYGVAALDRLVQLQQRNVVPLRDAAVILVNQQPFNIAHLGLRAQLSQAGGPNHHAPRGDVPGRQRGRGLRGRGTTCCSSPAVPCPLLHTGERKAVLRRARLPLHALGSRRVKLEAARKPWQEPNSLLSSVSAGLCSAQALGIPQGKGTGVARGAAGGASASARGYPCSWPSLPGLGEAVGCCEDPLWADEGPSTHMSRASSPGTLDAHDPGPGPWLGVCTPHHVRGAIVSSHGPEPAGPVTRNSSPSCSTARCCPG